LGNYVRHILLFDRHIYGGRAAILFLNFKLKHMSQCGQIFCTNGWKYSIDIWYIIKILLGDYTPQSIWAS